MTENEKLGKCLKVLGSAKTDNDKFAALLLVAKSTKSENLSSDEKETLLDAIGLTFLLRLLKTKSEASPDGCSPHIFKSLAMEILTGLCTDPGLMVRKSLHKILKPINDILDFDNSAFDEDDDMKGTVDNAMNILQGFSASREGVQQLINNDTVLKLAQIIEKDTYGSGKAADLCKVILMSTSCDSWVGQEETVHLLLNIFSTKMQQTQEQDKFELCEMVSFIMRISPISVVEDCSSRPWYRSILVSVKDIFTSKLGEPQRVPAIKMAATLLTRLGVEFILPPNTTDVRIFLVVTHLCCIEIKMVLEVTPLHLIISKAELLCACYQLLEIVISYMTVSPSLLLEDRQILQLHSAMLGAFNSVIFYLKEISEEVVSQSAPPDPVVIATVRVLGSWLAEETSALRDRTYEILPFLLKLCELQLQRAVVCETKGDNLPEKMESCSFESGENVTMDKDNKKVRFEESVTESCSCGQENSREVTEASSSENDVSENCTRLLNLDTKVQSESESSDFSQSATDYSQRSQQMNQSGENVDIIRFLLPGLCHLTSEDEPIKILLQNELQSILTKYFINCLKSFLEDQSDETIMKGLELVCNVFLNLTILVPKEISTREEFHIVTQSILETVPLLARKQGMIILMANMMTLGMFRMRYEQGKLNLMVTNEVKVKFFTSVVSFIKGAYTNVKSRNEQVLRVCGDYLPIWEDISQLWFLTVQAASECVTIHPEVLHAMLSSGAIPHIVKVLLAVQGREVGYEVQSCTLTLLTSVGSADPKAIEVIKSCGGLKLAEMYKSEELRQLLK